VREALIQAENNVIIELMGVRQAVVGVTTALSIVACETTTLPDAPSMDGLIQNYDAPDGKLSLESAQSMETTLAQRLTNVRRSEGMHRVVEALDAATQDSTNNEKQDNSESLSLMGVNLRGKAVLRVKNACDKVAADDEGFITATIVAEGNAIDEVVWGSFERCRHRLDRYKHDSKFAQYSDKVTYDETFLNGEYKIHFGSRIAKAEDIGRSPILVEYDGQLAENEEPASFDFRVTPEGLYEFRTQISGGHIVLSTDGNNVVTVRDRDGTWTCAFNKRRCRRGSVAYRW